MEAPREKRANRFRTLSAHLSLKVCKQGRKIRHLWAIKSRYLSTSDCRGLRCCEQKTIDRVLRLAVCFNYSKRNNRGDVTCVTISKAAR